MKLLSFLKTYLKKPSCLLGLDVSHTHLNLVDLSYFSPHYILNSAVQAVFPEENFSWQHPDFPAFLKQTLEQSNIKTRQAAFALPHSAVLFKSIELDKKLNTKEIGIQVYAHAERYFNYPLSELMLDFEVMGDSKQYPDLSEIRWVAAKKAEVFPIIEVLKSANLIPTILEVDSFALQRLAVFFMKQYYPDLKTTAMIHFYSANSFLLQILQHGETLYVRSEIENQTPTLTLQHFLNHAISQLSIKLPLIAVSGNVLPEDTLDEISEKMGIKTIYLDSFPNFSMQRSVVSDGGFCIGAGLAMRVCNEY